ncbi:MAG: hypothetical protein ABIT76_13880 [Chthoniobacterales bacterium]
MSQNLASLNLTTADNAALDAHLAGIESILAGCLVSLTPQQRQSLIKMGPKSRTFCEQAVPGIAANAASMTPDFDIPALQQDLADFGALDAFYTRYLTLGEKLDDTLKALSSDVMTNTIIGVTFLKALNKLKPSLDALLKALGSVRRAKPKAKPVTP